MAILYRAFRLNLRQKIFMAVISFLSIQMATALPRVASLNLCADSLLLELADPSQITSVSWLAQDEALSNYAELAKNYPSNHGHVEELIRYSPEFVFTGANTSAIDNALLTRLGFKVIQILPDRSVGDYENNLRQVGKAIGRQKQAEILISALHAKINMVADKPKNLASVSAIIFQANGYSPGADTLPGHMLKLAGLTNSDPDDRAAGKFLSLEELISLRPKLIVLTSLNSQNPSLADLYLSHPILSATQLPTINGFAWRPTIITVEERHFNCGSQFIAQSVVQMRQALDSLPQ